MSAVTRSRARRILSRVTAAWSDLDYAQRRLLEIQLGMSGLTRQPDRRTQAENVGPESHL